MTDLLERPSPASERPRIDPRIARRWIDARRQEGRRRLHVLLAVGALVGCTVLAFGSLYTPLFRVRHIRIAVDGPLSAGAVGRLAGVTTHTQTIDVNTGSIAARLDSYPSLGAARVARHWPGTVTISVAVRNPVAVISLPSGFAEVDPTGRVLADVATAPVGLPVLGGFTSVPSPGGWVRGTPGPSAAPGAAPGALVDMAAASDAPDVPGAPAAALAFLEALPPLLRSDVISVTAGAGRGLSLVVSPPRMATGNVTVLLGDGSQLQAKVTALVTILDGGDLSGVAGLDLTVPSRPATASTVAGLTPRPVPSAGAASAATGPGQAQTASGQPLGSSAQPQGASGVTVGSPSTANASTGSTSPSTASVPAGGATAGSSSTASGANG